MMVYGHPLAWWVVLAVVLGIVALVVFGLGYVCGADRALAPRTRRHPLDEWEEETRG